MLKLLITTLFFLSLSFKNVVALNNNFENDSLKDDISSFSNKTYIDDKFSFSANYISYNLKENIIFATGNVILKSQNNTFNTDFLAYNTQNEIILTKGKITLSEDDKQTIIGKNAIIDLSFNSGVLEDLNINFQDGSSLTAKTAIKKENNYEIKSMCYTACITKDKTPTWSLNAPKGIYNEEKGFATLYSSWIEIKGVPIFWIPYFSFSNLLFDRKMGFLEPKYYQDTVLGFTIEAPFYIPIGEHQDITITPYIYQNIDPLFIIKYNGYIKNGNFSINTSLTNTDKNPEVNSSWYFFGNYKKNLNDYFRTTINLELIKDNSYLKYYDLDPKNSRNSFYDNYILLEGFFNNKLLTFYTHNYKNSSDTIANNDILENLVEAQFTWYGESTKIGQFNIETSLENYFENDINFSKTSLEGSYKKVFTSRIGEVSFDALSSSSLSYINDEVNTNIYNQKYNNYSMVGTAFTWEHSALKTFNKYTYTIGPKIQFANIKVLSESEYNNIYQDQPTYYTSANSLFSLKYYNDYDTFVDNNSIKYALQSNIITSNLHSSLMLGQVINYNIKQDKIDKDDLAFSNIFFVAQIMPTEDIFINYNAIIDKEFIPVEQTIVSGYKLSNMFSLKANYYKYNNLDIDVYGVNVLSEFFLGANINLTSFSSLDFQTLYDKDLELKEASIVFNWNNECLALMLYIKQEYYTNTSNSYGFKIQIKNFENYSYSK